MPELIPTHEQVRRLNQLVERHREELAEAKQALRDSQDRRFEINETLVKKLGELSRAKATLFEIGQDPWQAGSILFKAIINTPISWRVWVAISVFGIVLLNLLVGTVVGSVCLYLFFSS